MSYVVLALLRIVGIEPLDTPPTRVNLDLGPCKVVIWNFTPSDDFQVTTAIAPVNPTFLPMVRSLLLLIVSISQYF